MLTDRLKLQCSEPRFSVKTFVYMSLRIISDWVFYQLFYFRSAKMSHVIRGKHEIMTLPVLRPILGNKISSRQRKAQANHVQRQRSNKDIAQKLMWIAQHEMYRALYCRYVTFEFVRYVVCNSNDPCVMFWNDDRKKDKHHFLAKLYVCFRMSSACCYLLNCLLFCCSVFPTVGNAEKLFYVRDQENRPQRRAAYENPRSRRNICCLLVTLL